MRRRRACLVGVAKEAFDRLMPARAYDRID